MPAVTGLHWNYAGLTGDIGSLAPLRRTLIHLDLGSTRVTGKLSTLSTFKGLIYLNLRFSESFPWVPAGTNGVVGQLSDLSALTQLAHLDLNAAPSITGTVHALRNCKLQYLDLQRTGNPGCGTQRGCDYNRLSGWPLMAASRCKFYDPSKSSSSRPCDPCHTYNGTTPVSCSGERVDGCTARLCNGCACCPKGMSSC